MNSGNDVEAQHHEVASAEQCEIDLRFQPLVKAADQLLLFKYIVKNTAKKNNKTVTYMLNQSLAITEVGCMSTQVFGKTVTAFCRTGYAI